MGGERGKPTRKFKKGNGSSTEGRTTTKREKSPSKGKKMKRYSASDGEVTKVIAGERKIDRRRGVT